MSNRSHKKITLVFSLGLPANHRPCRSTASKLGGLTTHRCCGRNTRDSAFNQASERSFNGPWAGSTFRRCPMSNDHPTPGGRTPLLSTRFHGKPMENGSRLGSPVVPKLRSPGRPVTTSISSVAQMGSPVGVQGHLEIARVCPGHHSSNFTVTSQ